MKTFMVPGRIPNLGCTSEDFCKFYSYLFTNWDEGSFQIRREEECSVCKDKQDLEIHHVIPFSKFGKHKDENLLILCKICHNNVHYRNLILKYKGCIDLKWKYQYNQFLELMQMFSSFNLFKKEVIQKISLIYQCRRLPYNRISHIPIENFIIRIPSSFLPSQKSPSN